MHWVERAKSTDGVQQQKPTLEQQLKEKLKTLKIGQSIKGKDLAKINKDAAGYISKVTKINETEFKIERTFKGSLGIESNAKMTTTKENLKIYQER
jgi:hypothetical protein